MERQKQKAVRREEAKQRRNENAPGHGGEDPDIAGIVPGPQKNPWGDEAAAPDDVDNAEEK